MTMEPELELKKLHIHADRVLTPVLWLLLAYSCLLAPWYGTWKEVFLIGLPSALVPTLLARLRPGALLSRCSVAASFMIFAGLEIHQCHGLIEMHFGIFALLAFLLYYRDWIPIIVASAVIAVHHLTFNFLQAWGVPVHVFDHGNGLTIVLMHAAYVVFEAAVLCFMAVKSRAEFLESRVALQNTAEAHSKQEQLNAELDVVSHASQRVRQALDHAGTPIIVADGDGAIIYANEAFQRLTRVFGMPAQADSESSASLVGSSVVDFGPEAIPAWDRLRMQTEVSTQRLTLHGFIFDWVACPVLDKDGGRQGIIVEWHDQTPQCRAMEQIESLIDGAVHGNLDVRIDVDRFDAGFLKTVAHGINRMLDAFINPYQQTLKVVQDLAEGQLTGRMDGDFQGSYAALRDAVNTSTTNLSNMVGEIRKTADTISHEVREIAQGNSDLSHRTQKQATSLEHTASSMEELTATVANNADTAARASQLASEAHDQATRGGEVVAQAITAMEKINDASKKIAHFVTVIDEIAFQTNLLALNAAVEAARAGDQGRGFAVVASEVRNLARKSADAASEIKGLINDSGSKVQEGTRWVGESGSRLAAIVESMRSVRDLITQIAASSREQTGGIGQVNKAVTELEQLNQQNAALVEQVTAVGDALDQEADRLVHIMAYFKAVA